MNKEERWENFRRWVADRRVKAGLTQQQAAERAGWKLLQQWSRYERGEPARKQTVIKIARGLGVSPSEAFIAAGYATLKESRKMLITEATPAMLNAVGITEEQLEMLEWLQRIQLSAGMEFDEAMCCKLIQGYQHHPDEGVKSP